MTVGQVTSRPIGDGHSNLTFLVTDTEGKQVVVRRPPPPPTPPGAHDMLREARLLDALHDTDVPVARVLAKVPEGEVLDVGFYVMTYVPGPVATTETPTALADPATRRQLGEALVDTLAALHQVDWRAAGLGDIGKPEGFNARHVRRMGALIVDDDGNPPPEFAAIDAWLKENVPGESGDAIIHNDFRLGNVILDEKRPGRVRAVLDWELATVGDPLCDLAYFLTSIPEEDGGRTPTEALGLAMLEDGWPTRDDLAKRYAEHTGADLSDLQWYEAMALWKLAVLYEYGRRRAVNGGGDDYYADGTHVEEFLTAAHRAAGL
ncbi:phosphotransferase family protein [Janibacter sp. YIM B02568]|uniref:phosphotransferase family protein n=1 Tax=Janibacter endophyticus TaxID=2806261 RepID=UPI00194FC2CB|nr:phosphotransferase family protein [Janibacter endophyticus]MBM6545442.1 phosphotransferase family protein [Janibacter endophyticus]